MSSERDPRIDPRPGDVLTKGDRRRVVILAHAEWSWVSYGAGASGRTLSCDLRSWREWARKATVEKRGEE